MFDIHCQHCGEAWDQDYLHAPDDLNGPAGVSYADAVKQFRALGCGFFRDAGRSVCNAAPVESAERLAYFKWAQSQSDHPEEWDLFGG
jgi:hypothetical protein